MIIIGLTGTNGAGKGSVVEYLVNTRGFKHLSVRNYLNRELERRGRPLDREELHELANELRHLHSPAYLIEELYREAQAHDTDCAIESIRNPGEIKALRDIGHFYLVAVDAPLEVRYERIKQRGSATDHISFEEFKAIEAAELTSTDPYAQNLTACCQAADYVIHNTGSLESFHQEIDKVLAQITA